MTLRSDFSRDWRAAGERFGLRVEVLKRWFTLLEKRDFDVHVQRRLLEDRDDGVADRMRRQDFAARWIEQALERIDSSA